MSDRESEFAKIKKNFETQCKPFLKTQAYGNFASQKLNNAVLLSYKTYLKNLDVFEKVFVKFDQNWERFIDFVKTLKDSKDPEKDFAQRL